MSNIRETILRLTQDESGRILDVKVEQEVAPKLLTVIELMPETKETFLRDLTEGSVVDWGDGTKSVVTAEDAKRGGVQHTYVATSDTSRVVTIDGVIDRQGDPQRSSFDSRVLTAVRSLVGVQGGASLLFNECDRLTSVPQNLFDHLTAGTTFNGCFVGCSRLTTIPAGIFDHCTAVTDLSGCFAYCENLTGESPYTMVGGKKIKLWERSPENGFAKVTSHEHCFLDCTMLSDYAEIPADWK